MCILFTKTDSNPESDEYYLILANVRDEYFWRPTQPLSFWQKEGITQIIGGKDLQKEREGGTWLAMNTNGKIGNLLNILQPDHDLSIDKKSRGFLVVDYLKSNYSPKEYLQQISSESQEYNGFRMIAIQIIPKNVVISVYSNFNEKVVELSSGINAFGNNRIENKLWPKVRNGKQKFEQIINKYGRTQFKPELIDSIFQLLADKTKYSLDQQMKSQGNGKQMDVLERMNAINVSVPENQYGSRTWTIILVDSSFNVDYIEKTMKDPINPNEKIEWTTTQKRFKIEYNIPFLQIK